MVSANLPTLAPAPSAEAGLTPELGQLIELSKSTLSRDEKRARLSAVLEKFPANHSRAREDLIVQAVARGALDPPEWTTITSNYKGRRARIQVTTDALTILGVRFDVTAEGAQRIADQLHAILPTPRILQLIWEQAAVRIDPCTLPPDEKMASTARMIQHSSCVDQRIGGRAGMVANEGKHWVLSNRIAGKDNLAANYGWFIRGRRPVQTVGTRHDTAHTDYSQILRLVKPIITVDGRDIDIRHVGRSPELWGLVSDEGPLLVWRATRPGTTPSPNQNPITVAPPPTPGDPASVRVTAKSKEMPIGLEQLPSTTTALRRNTFQRRIQSSLRMRPEDIPDAAYFSAAGAACGGRDLFFELMNEVPVELEELTQAKAQIVRGLACGKALTPQVRSGAAVYEVEYAYESVPSGFALLAVADDSFREKLLYPALSPTPSGVHRAYCNDDESGDARSVCRDGARSRLLLAVNNGYLAAYAREVPSLLERLSTSQPPGSEVAQLASLFQEPTEAEEVAVAKGGQCGFAMEFASVELSPDETSRQRVLDAINKNALFCGSQSSGTILDSSRRLLFLAKDAAGAAAISQALKQRALEVRFETGVALPTRPERQEFNKAMRSAAVRTAHSARLEVVGPRLSVTLTLVPNDAETRAMASFLDARAARAKAAAEVVLGLVEGRLPTAEHLQSFQVPSGRAP
ncbi:MAG TPA: hypothetical protein VJV79_37375 [Polyangiaceae bacterium]|nr:hypothetical protein [Polyangiaceae bacterium]